MVVDVGHGKLAHVELAQQHRPRILELGHHRGVLVRDVFVEYGGAAGGADACGVELVLHRQRQPVEWATVVACGNLRLSLPGRLQCLLPRYGDVRVQPAIDF